MSNKENQDFTAKRLENDEDKKFYTTEDIQTFKVDIETFYGGIKKQLNILFGINVAFSILAASLIFIAVVGYLFGTLSADYSVIIALASAISELLVTLFIKQYNRALDIVAKEYMRLLLCNNMNEALNLAKKLPVTDMRNCELRYLEIREILRPLMENFNSNITK